MANPVINRCLGGREVSMTANTKTAAKTLSESVNFSLEQGSGQDDGVTFDEKQNRRLTLDLQSLYSIN